MENEDLQALVMDNGSDTINAGFAGEDAPKSIFPSIVGSYKGAGFYIGDEAFPFRGVMEMIRPIEDGIITKWEHMEKIWHHTFFNELRVAQEQHPILLTESPLNSNANREKMTQMMFEKFNVPAMYVSAHAVLSLYASGRTTGVVIDSGADVTHSVPIYDGHYLVDTVEMSRVGGRDLTEYLKLMLNEKGYCFNTPKNSEVVREIKEELCFVSQDFHQDTETSLESAILEKNYKLPDGNLVTLGNERFKCPEALFSPELCKHDSLGIHDLLQRSISKCSEESRSTLYENIVLAGGSTMFTGVDKRLHKEIFGIRDVGVNVRIIAPPDRRNSCWIGGSILASLSTFQENWITKEEYDEVGSSIVNVKGMSTQSF